MRYRLFLSLVSVLFSFSCNPRKSNTEKETSQNDRLNTQIQANEKKMRMPILHLYQKDTMIQVKKESTISITIPFKNNGNDDLVLKNISSNCGCTIADFPKEPIRPGMENYIEVRYSSHGKSIRQETQPIVIESNSEKKFAKFNIKIIISEQRLVVSLFNLVSFSYFFFLFPCLPLPDGQVLTFSPYCCPYYYAFSTCTAPVYFVLIIV